MPTVRRCCIVGCLSNSRQNPQLQFFQFPKPENPFHKLWKQACHASLNRILPFKKPVVCALHFHPNCIGGRRLTSSAVPSMRLEVPSNLKAMEQQAMVEEIERSRKCAYINAVVYEWLVRANLNPQLRGSITHGMIKEKADTAKQIIGSSSFVADNRWLNRFRETHLTGFAQKLATNQLKPLGPSLWIPDIVQDLQHLFPPTSADRVANLENVPEQYMDYMQQYGEYEEDEDQESQHHQHQQQQQLQQHEQQSYHEQQQQHHYQHSSHHNGGYDPYQHHPANNGSAGYYGDDYYYERHQQHGHHHHHHPHASHHNSYHHSPQPHHHQQQQQQRASPHSPIVQPTQPSSNRSSPYQYPPAAKRPKIEDDSTATENLSPAELNSHSNDQIEDLTDGPEPSVSVDPPNISTSPQITKTNGDATPNGNSSSGAASPKSTNGQTTNGHTTPRVPTPISMKELQTYAQALEYLKPLEDFALFKENFRAIGLISQLEVILRKGDRMIAPDLDE